MKKLLLGLALSTLLLLTGCSTHSCRTNLSVPCESNFTKLDFRGPEPRQHPYAVYRTARKGPPVLVLHELNGLSAAPLDFSVELGGRGWTVYAPALFFKYGDSKPVSALSHLKRKDSGWKIREADDSGPVLDDVAAMVGWISKLHGGQRVIVMGNCLTGGFPLALLGRSDVKAAILCQPAMPTITFWQGIFNNQPQHLKERMALPPAKIHAALTAMKRDESKVLLGYHYLEDPVAPMEKFDWLHTRLHEEGLADRFKPVVLVRDGKGRREPWWDVKPTEVRKSLVKPHNTVTESGSANDRKRMREDLYGKLEKLRGR